MIAETIAKLQATNSSIEKVKILKAADTVSMRLFLDYTYNPYKIYNLGPAMLEDLFGRVPLLNNTKMTFDELKLLDDILSGRISGKAAVAKAYEVDNSGLLYYVLTKDLRCGISATTINKAMPGLIPQFKVQLAKEVPAEKIQFPVFCENKYDGVRLLALVEDGCVMFRTRNGKLVRLPHLARLMSQLKPGVYDGEIIHASDVARESRTSISGKINSAMRGGRVNESEFQYKVFDYLTFHEFHNQKSTTKLMARRLYLIELLRSLAPEQKYVSISSGIMVHDIQALELTLEETYGKGSEGLIAKDPNSLYEFKRSKVWAKFKQIKTADLTCVATEEGSGKYEGCIGALVCQGNVEGKFVEVSVGTGLSDYDRFKPESTYIGKTIEVKYNEVIPGFKTAFTLFLPRFVEVRIDK